MFQVSVIIPCYNHGRYLDEAINSVLNQTYQDFEIVIINDGSTDVFTINKLKEINNPKCRVISTKNNGLAAARNLGLKMAVGKYIQFLDADDVLDERKLELQVSKLDEAPLNSLSYCDYFSSIENDLKVENPSRYLTPAFRTSNYLYELINNWQTDLSIPCHTFLFNRSLFVENSISFDESLPNHEDWDCWLNIFRLNPVVIYIDKKLVTYRIHDKSMSHKTYEMRRGFLEAIKNQKEKFSDSGYEYRLLTIRYNRIRYGFESEYMIIAMIVGKIRKLYFKAKKRLLFHG